MEGRTEGDFEDFRRNLDRLEADFPGTNLLGSSETQSWPTYSVTESSPNAPPRAGATATGGTGGQDQETHE
jgi:hypothetical protein